MPQTHQQSSGSGGSGVGRGLFWGLVAASLLICGTLWKIHNIETHERYRERQIDRALDIGRDADESLRRTRDRAREYGVDRQID